MCVYIYIYTYAYYIIIRQVRREAACRDVWQNVGDLWHFKQCFSFCAHVAASTMYVAICCHSLPQFAINVCYWKLPHFCDDPMHPATGHDAICVRLRAYSCVSHTHTLDSRHTSVDPSNTQGHDAAKHGTTRRDAARRGATLRDVMRRDVM